MMNDFEDLGLDVDKILKTMNDDKSEYLFGLTSKKIKELNRHALKGLNVGKQVAKEWDKKLARYKYVDTIDEVKYGGYVRWVHLGSTEMSLWAGGIVCAINVTDEGINIACKNFKHRYFQFAFNECAVFQKLTDQELILLSALDYIESEK
jgi:hypothetical protein